MARAKKTSIDDYKDRMTSPVVAVRIDPKTGKQIKRSRKSSGKRR